jgi:hypothetical protein
VQRRCGSEHGSLLIESFQNSGTSRFIKLRQ